MRPLHFFGRWGVLSGLAGCGIALWLGIEKFYRGVPVMGQHGPLMIFAAVLILAGVQLLALGLLGEMQVRHYYTSFEATPYSVAKVIRTKQEANA
jgi:hypothetical protein